MNEITVVPDTHPSINDDEDSSPNLNLRRVSGEVPLSAFILLVVNFCERFSFFGIMVLFQNYLQNPLPPGGNGAGAPGSVDDPYPAGALNLGQSLATALQLSIWSFATIMPLPTSIVADSKWGKFRTLAIGLFIDVLGTLILTFTAMPASIASGLAFKGWIVGALFFSVGTGSAIGMCSKIS